MIKSRLTKEKLEIIAKMRGKKPHEMIKASDIRISKVLLVLEKKVKK